MSLPAGTVTFLFTDIEGSTRLLQEVGGRYASLIADHHRLLRSAFAARGGTEVRRQHPGWSEAALRRELVRYAFHPGTVPSPLR